ncbi:MAG: 4-demethylwyosine synthase TYW1 [Candidatus Aenigmatarchaeota archaeon]
MKEGYKIFGNNAVKLCLWLKKSIKTGEREFCYKQKFYGIKSHRCLQMTPSQPFCNLRCLHCWRDISTRKPIWENGFDEPEEIIEKSIQAQRILLAGLGGVPHSEKHLKEAQNPKHVAISLDGEPCLYPKLSELIQGFHKRGMTTFLVTNGTFPEVLEKIQLPTQLYVSLTSNSEKIFNKIQNPIERGWKELNQTLELLPNLKTRKVIRLTLVKNLNFSEPEKYADLILKAKPDFIEVKSAMAVGFAKSQNRLKYSDMPYHEEIKQFSKKLSDILNYKIKNEKVDSRVVLLKR